MQSGLEFDCGVLIINSVHLPPNYKDMVFYAEVLHGKLQAGHSTKTVLGRER